MTGPCDCPCLLPAPVAETILELEGRASLLVACVPDLTRHVIGRLRAAGVPNAVIAPLGGRTSRNDLLPLLGATPLSTPVQTKESR